MTNGLKLMLNGKNLFTKSLVVGFLRILTYD